ncbi:hypothetical protein PMAYCL1PPCAC_26250, partial [Pristionchus mayeri]
VIHNYRGSPQPEYDWPTATPVESVRVQTVTTVHYIFSDRAGPCPYGPFRLAMTLKNRNITHEDATIGCNHKMMLIVVAHSMEMKPPQVHVVIGTHRLHLIVACFGNGFSRLPCSRVSIISNAVVEHLGAALQAEEQSSDSFQFAHSLASLTGERACKLKRVRPL